MKKAILTAAALIAISTTAQAFTINKKVEVNAFQYNEILDKHLPTEMKVWTGVDPETNKGYVEIHVDGGLQTFKMGFNEGDEGLSNWKHMIDKTVEWSEVAKQNKVDIEKFYNDFDVDKKNYSSLYNCSSKSTKCYSKFSSWSDGARSTMYLNLQASHNEFIKFNGQVPIAEVVKLKATMDNLESYWQERRQELKNKPKGDSKTALFK